MVEKDYVTYDWYKKDVAERYNDFDCYSEDEKWDLMDEKAFCDGKFQTRKQKDMTFKEIHTERKFDYTDVKNLIVKCGYFIFKGYQRKYLTNLYHHKDVTDSSCGLILFHKGFTDRFSYYTSQPLDYDLSIEADVYNIPELCKENIDRKDKQLRCLPFDRNYQREDGLYVSWSTCSLYSERELKVIDADIKSIIDYFNLHGFEVEFVEMSLREPIISF